MKEKTAPWMPFNVEWWPAIADTLPKPWPIEAVNMDLRWWADQEAMGRAKMPSRRRLQQRWGLSEYRTRSAMRDVLQWSKPQTPPNKTPNTSQSHPKNSTQTPDITGTKTPETSQTPPNKTPNTSTRAELHTTNNTLQTTENKTLTSDRLAPVRQLWSELNQVRVDLDSRSKPLKLTDARQRTLKARLKEHTAQDVVAVVKWWLQSSHQRAQYLRDNGYGIDTVLRPSNFTTYLELSRMPPPKPKATAFSVPPPAPRRTNEPPALSLYSERQIAAVKADLEDLQATCQPDTWDRMVRTALAQSYGQA